MQSYVNVTLRIFVVALVSFLALSGCEKELSDVIEEKYTITKSVRRDSVSTPADSIPNDTIITLPDTLPFPFPYDSRPIDTVRIDTLPGDSIPIPPLDTLLYEYPPLDSLGIDSTVRD